MAAQLLSVMLKNGHITQDIYDFYQEGLTPGEKKTEKDKEDEKPEFVVIRIEQEDGRDKYKKIYRKFRKLADELDLKNEEYNDPETVVDFKVVSSYMIYDILNHYSKEGYLCEAGFIPSNYNDYHKCSLYLQFRLIGHTTRNYNKNGKFIHYFVNSEDKHEHLKSYSSYGFKFDI